MPQQSQPGAEVMTLLRPYLSWKERGFHDPNPAPIPMHTEINKFKHHILPHLNILEHEAARKLHKIIRTLFTLH